MTKTSFSPAPRPTVSLASASSVTTVSAACCQETSSQHTTPQPEVRYLELTKLPSQRPSFGAAKFTAARWLAGQWLSGLPGKSYETPRPMNLPTFVPPVKSKQHRSTLARLGLQSGPQRRKRTNPSSGNFHPTSRLKDCVVRALQALEDFLLLADQHSESIDYFSPRLDSFGTLLEQVRESIPKNSSKSIAAEKLLSWLQAGRKQQRQANLSTRVNELPELFDPKFDAQADAFLEDIKFQLSFLTDVQSDDFFKP